MANKMLIDAGHPEETRVVVVRGNRVEEFDFESENRKQLRGNIYLAKVTRVEPSLQAAFVDYGGNRHGFLAFSEIHPDYYQIPVADRQALIQAEEREEAESEKAAAEANADEAPGDAEEPSEAVGEPEQAGDISGEQDAALGADAMPGEAVGEPADADDDPEATNGPDADNDGEEIEDPLEVDDAEEDDHAEEFAEADLRVESVGADDVMEELPVRRRARQRQYKIQEVIKRRQVMLVQVVKEERGNKGAALTTYLSLAGRYSVLMPNTARGGGISRKITSVTDRKRLKQVVSDLDMPEGMGVILRTAGAARTKAEVKRDFEYLLRLWENVRELTLNSSAPSIVYEEGSLIKRSIRDLYNKEIDDILVAGDDGYREAKDFMRMLMPSHAKNVKPYKEAEPLFAGSGIEAQLDAMFSPQVTLRSGGYIVINQTEALVSIDVNSGRSTREHNIEDTALRTNLEAAEEIARQLRLRDLAGLVVIDFIDMDKKRNNRAVERKLKEALKHDRARIQVGRISPFGLLEMSRQRLRTGVLESTTTACPTCQGAGHVRAASSVALHVLRSLEDQLLKSSGHHLSIRTRTPVALYVLNNKRSYLSELEARFGLAIAIEADETISDGAHFAIVRGDAVGRREVSPASVQPDTVSPETDEDGDQADIDEARDERPAPDVQGDAKRGRRRRRRRSETSDEAGVEATASPSEASSSSDGADGDTAEAETGTEKPSRRPRRRRRRETTDQAALSTESPAEGGGEAAEGDSLEAGSSPADEAVADDQSQPARRRRRGGRRGKRGAGEKPVETAPEGESGTVGEDAPVSPDAGQDASSGPVNGADPDQPEQPPAETAQDSPAITVEGSPAPVPVAVEEVAPPDSEPSRTEMKPADEPAPSESGDQTGKPKRSGWWQRGSFF